MGVQNRVQKTENNMYGWITKCVVLRRSVGIRGGKDYRQLDLHRKDLPKTYIWDFGGCYLGYLLRYSQSLQNSVA